jgi:hypothetical protein
LEIKRSLPCRVPAASAYGAQQDVVFIVVLSPGLPLLIQDDVVSRKGDPFQVDLFRRSDRMWNGRKQVLFYGADGRTLL